MARQRPLEPLIQVRILGGQLPFRTGLCPPQNRLAAEKSPYLLQHGHNPVDWFPWGPEAFARAEAEDRPVFLSIGLRHVPLVPRDGAGVL